MLKFETSIAYRLEFGKRKLSCMLRSQNYFNEIEAPHFRVYM
jgi:hypothetical protein